MPYKTKVCTEEKVRIIQDCIAGKFSIGEAAREAGVDKKSVRRWIARYNAEENSALWRQERTGYTMKKRSGQQWKNICLAAEVLKKFAKSTKFAQKDNSGIGFRCIIAAEASNTKRVEAAV